MLNGMMHRIHGIGCVLAASWLIACSAEQVRYRPLASPMPPPEGAALVLYLVGDGGEVNSDREAVLTHLRADIESVTREGSSPPVIVSFLGDNIYDNGATVERLPADVEKLAGQVLALAKSGNVEGLFIPGNHDWANGGPFEDGREALARQVAWLEAVSEGRRVRFVPSDGCPGPVTKDVADVHLVFIDTEWILRDADGRCGSAADFYDRLAADLRAHADRRVVLLSHHPLATGGPHGGNVAPLRRGPFVYYLATRAGASRQDLSSPAYTEMRRELTAAIGRAGMRPLLHAAGHDHTLQVIRLNGSNEPHYQLVSGALSKTESVRRIAGMRYGADGFGYMRLDFFPEAVGLSVFRRDVSGGPVEAVFQCTIAREGPPDECPEAPLVADGA
jgi:hypothetical protein